MKDESSCCGAELVYTNLRVKELAAEDGLVTLAPDEEQDGPLGRYPAFVSASAPTKSLAMERLKKTLDRFCLAESAYLTRHANEHGKPVSSDMRQDIRRAFQAIWNWASEMRAS